MWSTLLAINLWLFAASNKLLPWSFGQKIWGAKGPQQHIIVTISRCCTCVEIIELYYTPLVTSNDLFGSRSLFYSLHIYLDTETAPVNVFPAQDF